MPPLDKVAGVKYDGMLCLSRGVFVENWLLPRLEELNRESTWIVDNAWHHKPRLTAPEYGINGHQGAKPEDLKNNPTGLRWPRDANEPSTLVYRYYNYSHKSTPEENKFHRLYQTCEQGPYLIILTLAQAHPPATTENKVRITAGSGFGENDKPTIKISGKTVVQSFVRVSKCNCPLVWWFPWLTSPSFSWPP